MVQVPQVQIPDFVGSLMRGEQMQQSRLQALAQQQALNDAARFDSTLAEIAPALAAGQGPEYDSALTRLMGAGRQGFAMALPLQQQRRQAQEAAQFNWDDDGSGGATPPVSAAPLAPAAPAGGGAAGGPADPRERNAEAARRRQAIMDDASLSPEQQQAELARVSSWLAAPAAPERPGGYRANPGADAAGRPFAGMAPPSGVIPVTLPASGAPVQAPSGGVSPAMMDAALRNLQRARATGNPAIIAQAQDRIRGLQLRAQMARQEGGGAGSEPLETVEGPDGRPVLVPRSQAAGRTPVRTPPVQVNNMPNPGDTPRARADTATLTDMQRSATEARQIISLFDRAEQAVRRTPEGQGAQLLPVIGQTARALGIEIAGTAEAEVLRSLTNSMAVLQRAPGSGATTDFEMRLYMQAVPRLGNTRDGNLRLIDIGRRLAQRRIEEASIWRRHAGEPDVMERIEALPRVFTENDTRFLMQDAVPASDQDGIPGPGGQGVAIPPPPPGFRPLTR